MHPEEYLDYKNVYGFNITSYHPPFLFWTEKSNQQVKDDNWQWDSIFDAEPYLSFSTDSKGNVFPNSQILINRCQFLFDKTEREKRYSSFLHSLKLNRNDECTGRNVSIVHNYREALEKQLFRGINELEKIDVKIQAVLKVIYFEAKMIAIKKEDKTSFFDLLNDISDLYKIGIRTVCNPNKIENHWLPKMLEQIDVADSIINSTKIGLLFYLTKKDPVVDALITTFEKYLHLETVLQQIFNNTEITDHSYFLSIVEKFSRDKYYATAIQIRNDSDLTWQETYEVIKNETDALGIENKHTTYEGFFTSIKKFRRGS